MTREQKLQKEICKLSVDQKIARAQELSSRVLDHARLVMHFNASNRELLSDQIARQVPNSYAAHTFNLLCHTQHHFGLIRLTALWDNPSEQRESIPTLLKYVRDESVQQELERRYAAQWGQVAGCEDIELRALIENSEVSFGRSEAAKCRRILCLAIRAADRFKESQQLSKLFKFRDAHVAHNLNSGAPVTPESRPRSGDVEFALERTIRIIDGLNRGIRGAGFDWAGAKRIAGRNAKAFWGGVSVRVLE